MDERKIKVCYQTSGVTKFLEIKPENAWRFMVETAIGDARYGALKNNFEMKLEFFPEDMYIMVCYVDIKEIVHYTYE